jgi:hypothetical protein
MVKSGIVTLIVPRLLLEEFRKNRDRIAKESAKSLSAHFKLVKEAVGKIGGDKKKMAVVLSHLDDVDHKIPILGGSVVGTLDRIESLLSGSAIIDPTDSVILRAARRAVARKAPFHHDKNSIGDAILIETYAECLREKACPRSRFAFVTHNKNDFSLSNGNQKIPHPDFAELFSRIKSLYFINLAEALRRIEPSLVTDVMLEHSWTQEPRGLAEILEAEDLLLHQVWYNRHWNLRIAIEEGKVKVVDKKTYPGPAGAQETVQRDIWKGALKKLPRASKVAMARRILARGTTLNGAWSTASFRLSVGFSATNGTCSTRNTAQPSLPGGLAFRFAPGQPLKRTFGRYITCQTKF